MLKLLLRVPSKIIGSFSKNKKEERAWDERIQALEQHLGPSSDIVHHAVIPLFMGGEPDIVEFPRYCDGVTYATAELTDPYDPECPEDACEFVICTRQPVDWYGSWFRGFAFKSAEHVFKHGDIWDFTNEPDGSPFGPIAFIVFELTSDENPLLVMGKRYRLMLIMNLTQDELHYLDKHGKESLIKKLQQSDEYPYADPARPSIA